MAEKAVITEQVSGTGAIFLADEFSAVDNTVVVPYTKIMDGSAGSTATMQVNAFGRAKVNAELTSNTNLAISGSVNARISAALPAGTNQIGKVELTGSSQVTIQNATLAVTQSGAWDVSLSGTGNVVITDPLPAGTNQIGKVELTGSSQVAITTELPAGTNQIGKVELTGSSQVVIGAGTNQIGKVELTGSSQVSINAGTNLIGQAVVGQNINTVYDGTTALTPKYANISVNAAAATDLIASVAAKKLRILAMSVIAEATAGFYLQDAGGDSNNLMGDSTNPVEVAPRGGFVLPYNPVGWTETSASAAFQIVPNVATSIAGMIVYVEV